VGVLPGTATVVDGQWQCKMCDLGPLKENNVVDIATVIWKQRL